MRSALVEALIQHDVNVLFVVTSWGDSDWTEISKKPLRE